MRVYPLRFQSWPDHLPAGPYKLPCRPTKSSGLARGVVERMRHRYRWQIGRSQRWPPRQIAPQDRIAMAAKRNRAPGSNREDGRDNRANMASGLGCQGAADIDEVVADDAQTHPSLHSAVSFVATTVQRSEERRVGEEC